MPIPGRRAAAKAPVTQRGHFRGEEGRRRAEEELVKAKAKAELRKEQGNLPFRYRISPGESGSFVILDDEPNFYRFEHNLQNPATGFFDLFIGCCAEWDNCPACNKSDAYYGLFMTVIDLVPYTNKQGVTTEFARKLLVVKPAQQKKFIRAYQRALKEFGTLRGVVFETTRDGKMDSAIGNDIEMTDEFIPEEDLQTYVRTWKDRENKKHTENCSEVFDYETLFPEPTVESIGAALGEGPQPGTRAHEDKVLGRGRAAPARRRAAAQEDEEDDDQDQEDEAPSARKRGTWQKPGTTARMTTSRGRNVEPEEDDQEEEEEAPPPRRAGARTALVRNVDRAPTRRGSRRVEEEQDEEEDEAPPQRRTAPQRQVPQRSAGRTTASAPVRNPTRRRAEPVDDDDDIPF